MNEAQVISWIREGDTGAFSQIIEHYQAPITRYLYRYTGDHALAQDLAQDTFLHAYRAILKTDSELSLKAWLYRIATNNALQHLRRERILSFMPHKAYGKSDIPDTDVHSDQVEERIVIQETLLEVQEDQRTCMVLHFIEGLKYREIGEILDISEEAVRKRVARGSQKFRSVYLSLTGGESR